MKHLSIRLKITLWFTAFLVFVVALTYAGILSVSNQVIQKTIRDSLIETVEHNVDEIEYYRSIDDVDLANDVDHFIAYAGGYLEVDDDFLDAVNQVYTALYSSDQTLLYGENPIAGESFARGLADSRIQKITVGGTGYYIFDRALDRAGLEGLWLRGVVSEAQGKAEMSAISRLSLILLPTLVLIAAVGGYLLAKRMLRPVQQISDAAAQIGERGDLKKRIELGEGGDELHQLADRFNEMFARLDEAFEKERQFTADASHEMRTPMSVIMAQCELALEGRGDEADYVKALQVIQRQGKKMTRLINDMLDFTRLEQRADQYPRESVDLSALVRSVCADLSLVRERGITLCCEAEGALMCRGNRELLTRLLTNLVSNAYRYGRDHGHILVKLARADGAVRLSVADDGIGIAPAEREKIFRRFYRADTARAGGGTGLGLAMASEIAKWHGGVIEVESEQGKGSVFTLVLPDAAACAEKE